MMCTGCVMTPTSGKKLCSQTPCKDLTSDQTTSGMCASPGVCAANSSSGGLGSIGDLLKSIASMIQALNQQSSSGSGSGSASGSGSTCTQYYQVSTPSTDPCAYYVPSTSSNISPVVASTTPDTSCDPLSAELGTCSNNTPAPSVSSLIQNTPQPAPSSNSEQSTGTPQTVYVANSVLQLTPGISGNVRVGADGVTVFVNKLDVQQNSEVAGFYGTNTTGTQQSGDLITSWCRNRPWASNFLSFLIPPTFFDSLCSLNGYQVGIPDVSSGSSGVIYVHQQQAAAPVPQPAAPTADAEADIWSVPTAARLGSRVTVFWSAKNVASCVETSPDGSFSQSSVSGGAATVPITGATTYSIACDTPDGKHITNYVTVELAP